MNHVALIAGVGPHAGADALLRLLAACRREIALRGPAITEQGGRIVHQLLDRIVQRVDTLIPGCTGLGLVLIVNFFHNKLVDAADVLASALAAKACDIPETKK